MSYTEMAKLMTYNKDTGKVYWKEGLGHRYAGKEAGYIHDEGKQRYKIKYKNKRYFRARLGWTIHYGKEPDGIIDHINGIPWDDRLENLRVVTPVENSLNCKMSKSNKTGKTGVAKSGGKFQVSYRSKYLGRFETFEEAVKVREAAEQACPYITNRHGK